MLLFFVVKCKFCLVYLFSKILIILKIRLLDFHPFAVLHMIKLS